MNERKICNNNIAKFLFLCQIKMGKDKECWLYRGRVDKNGYGVFCYGGVHANAHRLMWLIIYGLEGAAKIVVHHKCRNKLCVNPKHLMAMSNSDHLHYHKTKKYRRVKEIKIGEVR